MLERPGDDPAFADLVRDVVVGVAPEHAGHAFVVHDLEGAAPAERARYEQAVPVRAWEPLAGEVVARVHEHGCDTSAMVRDQAFAEARRARLRTGEALVEPGSPPSYVHVPLAPGLVVRPVGGYAEAALHPWVPVGATGASRRAPRNAAIHALSDRDVLMLPSEHFVASWLCPLEPHQLRERLLGGG